MGRVDIAPAALHTHLSRNLRAEPGTAGRPAKPSRSRFLQGFTPNSGCGLFAAAGRLGKRARLGPALGEPRHLRRRGDARPKQLSRLSGRAAPARPQPSCWPRSCSRVPLGPEPHLRGGFHEPSRLRPPSGWTRLSVLGDRRPGPGSTAPFHCLASWLRPPPSRRGAQSLARAPLPGRSTRQRARVSLFPNHNFTVSKKLYNLCTKICVGFFFLFLPQIQSNKLTFSI